MGKKYYSNDFITKYSEYLDITPIKSSKKSYLPKIIIICALIIIGIILYIINNNKIEEEEDFE